MYRYLFFDADGTLFDFDEAETQALLCMATTLGITLTQAQLDNYKARNEACWKAFERAEITQETLKIQRFEDFFASEGLKLDPKYADQVYQKHLSQQGILYEESRFLLEELLRRGYSLYLASNGIATVQRGRLSKSQTEHYFQDIFISEEIGSQKPQREFFATMLNKTNLEEHKSSCLMIGDSLTSDIAGGLSYGIDTLWLNMRGLHTNTTAFKPTYEVHSLTDMLSLLQGL